MQAAAQDAVEWHPSLLVRDNSRASSTNEHEPASFALLVLNQPLHHHGVIKRVWKNASMYVAADGGANCLYDAGHEQGHDLFDNLEVIIGDLDSLRDDVRTHFESGPSQTRVIHIRDDYSTDFTKAVTFMRSRYRELQQKSSGESVGGRGASSRDALDIVAIGGLGGRVDQGLSQLHHLYLFHKDTAYSEGRLYLISGESLTFLLKAGKHRIRVRDGGEEVFDKYVGILPVKEPSVITTKGLEWDVTDWETEFGGRMSTSNHVLPDTEVVEVETTKDVLFTIALKDLD